MVKLRSVVKLVGGSPQFRIAESSDDSAPIYTFYEQQDIDDDLAQIDSKRGTSKQVRTFDSIKTVDEHNAVFSLISGKAAIVGRAHAGYLYTQNFVKLVPSAALNARYLVYLLNEDPYIYKQMQIGLQGSMVLKYTLKQLDDLTVPTLPAMQTQELIGNLYFDQLHLTALRHKTADNMTTLIFETIKKAVEQ